MSATFEEAFARVKELVADFRVNEKFHFVQILFIPEDFMLEQRLSVWYKRIYSDETDTAWFPL